MLSNGFVIPIRIEPTPSRYFIVLAIIVHGLAMLALLLPSSVPLWARVLIGLGVLVSCIWHLKKNTCNLNTSWVCQGTGKWQSSEDIDQHNWYLSGVSTLTNLFVSFSLADDAGKKANLLIFRDQLDEDTFRRLRVYLRYAQVEATMPGETI